MQPLQMGEGAPHEGVPQPSTHTDLAAAQQSHHVSECSQMRDMRSLCGGGYGRLVAWEMSCAR